MEVILGGWLLIIINFVLEVKILFLDGKIGDVLVLLNLDIG